MGDSGNASHLDPIILWQVSTLPLGCQVFRGRFLVEPASATASSEGFIKLKVYVCLQLLKRICPPDDR